LLLHTIDEVRKIIKKQKQQNNTIGLVPTMGALHEGHLSLIKKAKETCSFVVVSVFVNPTQFGPSEDFDKYPRTLDADLDLCKKENVDILFAPSVTEMYGEEAIFDSNNFTYVIPPYFYVDKLCGASRVGHFDGVCTVVNKLFNIVQPDFAFFGEKDAQQAIIIKKMVKDLNIPVDIITCPIIRSTEGLALSSRNKYLSDEGKQNALVLNKILNNIKSCYKKGIKDIGALKDTAFSFLTEKHELEYLEFFDNDTLNDKTVADDNTRVFIACKVEGIRLIDNINLRD